MNKKPLCLNYLKVIEKASKKKKKKIVKETLKGRFKQVIF